MRIFAALRSRDKLRFVKELKRDQANLLSATQEGKTLLHAASEIGAVEMMELLLRTYGCKVDSLDGEGYSPIELAARYVREKGCFE